MDFASGPDSAIVYADAKEYMDKLTRNFCSALLVFSGALTTYAVDNPQGATGPAAEKPPVVAPIPVVSPVQGTAVSPAGGPKIQFATPIYDFGKVQAGELVKYSYVFTNTGEAVLEVTDVHPSCGCTTAGDWTRTVKPGDTGKVSVQFNSANFNGPVYKTVSVTCNDKQRPSTVLQLKGSVWKPIELVPQYTVMNVPPDATSASATIRILNHVEEPLMVFSPECNNTSFSATLTTNTLGKEYQVSLVSARELSAGNVQGKITLKTSSAKTPSLDLMFWANVQPPLTILPQRVSLPPPPLKVKSPTTVTIQNNSTNLITLSDAKVNVPGVGVEVKEVQPGRLFNAVLSFPDGFELPAGLPVMLTMKSSQPRVPEIRVPIVQTPRPMYVAPPAPKLAPPAASASVKPAAGTTVTQ